MPSTRPAPQAPRDPPQPAAPELDTTGQLTISSSRTPPPDTPCLKGHPGRLTMPIFRTSTALMTCSTPRTSAYSEVGIGHHRAPEPGGQGLLRRRPGHLFAQSRGV